MGVRLWVTALMVLSVSTLATMAPVAPLAWAAGSFEPVNVKLFLAGKNGQYSMIVVPVAKTNENSAGGVPAATLLSLCKELRVFGGLDQKHWQNRPEVTVEGHQQAIALLQRAYQNKATTNFGELGAGFRVANKSAPCTVKSRGLVFWRDATADAALSVYQAF